MQMFHFHSFHAYLSRRHLQQATHGHGRGALRSPSRRYNTALHTNSPKHFHKILTKENLEFLDPLTLLRLRHSSQAACLPFSSTRTGSSWRWRWRRVGVESRREYFTTQLDQDGRTDRQTDRTSVSSIVGWLTRAVRKPSDLPPAALVVAPPRGWPGRADLAGYTGEKYLKWLRRLLALLQLSRNEKVVLPPLQL